MVTTKTFLLAAFGAATFTGCSSPPVVTESSTYKSPLSRGREFRRVAVWTKAGLTARQQTESWAVAALREQRIDAVASLDIWPIDASKEEIEGKLKANGIGAVLVLALDAVSRTSSVATTTTTLFGNTDIATSQTSTTNKFSVVFLATLFNDATGRVAWQSQATTSGSPVTSWDDINVSFVQKTAADLVAAQVIYLCLRSPPPPAPDAGPPPGPDASDAEKKRYAARVAHLNQPPPPLPPDECPPQEPGKALSAAARP